MSIKDIETGSNPEGQEKPDVRQEIERFCAGSAIDAMHPGQFKVETDLDTNKANIQIFNKEFVGSAQNETLAKFLHSCNSGYDHVADRRPSVTRGESVENESEWMAHADTVEKEFQEFVQEQLTNEVAGQLHDEWRRPRWKKETSDYDPRLKATKDKAWIEAHGVDQVDIANTSYENLPEDWQAENKMSASVAVGGVLKVLRGNRGMENAFVSSKAEDHYGSPDYSVKGIKKTVESVSDVVHQEWLKRNGEWAPAEQKKDYKDLSEEEQEKDRVIVRRALETCAGREKEIGSK